MQAGFGYPQQLVPGMRPGGAPMPNFFVPMGQQGQQGQRPGGRRGAGPIHQLPQSLPMMQQQVCSCSASWILCYFSRFCYLCLLLRCFLMVFSDASKGTCLPIPSSWSQPARYSAARSNGRNTHSGSGYSPCKCSS